MEKVTAAVLITRREATVEASLARRRDLRKLGTAIAAMISNTLTTMSSSIREKPFCFRMSPPKATPNPPSAGRPCRPVWNLNSTKSERWDLVHDSRHTKILKSRASILYFAVRRPGSANLSTVREYRVPIQAAGSREAVYHALFSQVALPEHVMRAVFLAERCLSFYECSFLLGPLRRHLRNEGISTSLP